MIVTPVAKEPSALRNSRGLKDRKSTRLNSSHSQISYAVFCLKKTDADTVASTTNVQTTFFYAVQHDLHSSRQQNGVYNGDKKFKRYGVADLDGGNALAWITAP